MFFLGGMTLGYLEPPKKTVLAKKSVRKQSVRRNRKIATFLASLSTKQSAADSHKLWAWRTIC